MSRYARQMILPQVGTEGQARLQSAHVLVVGAGGLGVPVMQYLAGAGVGMLTLIDGDHVEEGNLHRQPLYRMADIGRPKVQAAAEAIRSLNPDTQVCAQVAWLDPDIAPDRVAAADLVLDCADTFAASLTLSDACRAAGKPLITASALGLQGYVAGVCGNAPSLRAIFPDLPISAPTCATAGVLGPVVAMMGALQAQMALSVLLGLSPTPLGQMMIFDAERWRMAEFRFDDAPEPVADLPFIAASAICTGDLVIDLRTEAPAPFRPDALHLSADALTGIRIAPEIRRIVLACRTGLRAHNGAQTLRTRWPGEIVLLSVTDA
ncbi:HesA/MoeB/ThiF family protein [Roseovarius sp. M141]|uniref:HesA/MoeB/ThiF family protein n=1 Tax=Roseovarius sp. M141 TaxID=2583806 RepID=UPI0020CF7E2B|nr:HesA/MoeB/ThiF family protein [Roseovarius sp. M141]MCQ0091977.1 HesA/MoeB/ThiF family protein [Roseovarius sp. M141]